MYGMGLEIPFKRTERGRETNRFIVWLTTDRGHRGPMRARVAFLFHPFLWRRKEKGVPVADCDCKTACTLRVRVLLSRKRQSDATPQVLKLLTAAFPSCAAIFQQILKRAFHVFIGELRVFVGERGVGFFFEIVFPKVGQFFAQLNWNVIFNELGD